MSLPSRQIHVRLSADALKKLDQLQESFGGLPPSAVVRFLLLHILDQPLDEQLRIVTQQIMKKPGTRTRRPHSGMNTRNRVNL